MTFKKIVVGLDQSFKDSAVFAQALEQARPHQTSILLVHTIPAEPSMAPVHMPAGKHTSEARDMYKILSRQHQARFQRNKNKAQEWLEMYFQQALAKGIPTQVQCQSGDPGLWLCELAQRWGADLIIMGHRENHGLRSVGKNSISNYVLQHAPCSVLIIQGSPELDEFNQVDRTVQTKPLVTTPASDRLESQMFKI